MSAPTPIGKNDGVAGGVISEELYFDNSVAIDVIEERTKQLAMREAKLRLKEEQLRMKQQSDSAIPKKNWPRAYPLFYHNIGDIPIDDADGRDLVNRSYFLWKLTLFAYLWNLVAMSGMMFSHVEPYNSLSNYIASIVYLVIFPSLGFICWHLLLFNAVLKKSSIRYIIYFGTFGVQLAFYIFLGLGWQIGGGGGILALITMLSKRKFICAFLSAASVLCQIFCLLLGSIQYKSVIMRYRSLGMDAKRDTRNYVIGEALKN
jgi:hypothetical protein